MKSLFLLLLLPLVLLAACGDDDDDSNPEESGDLAAGYVGGVRDAQLALNDVVNDPVNDPNGGPADSGPLGGDPASYRAQADAYREFVAGLEELEVPPDVVEDQEALIAATVALAGDLDMLAEAIETGDSAKEELARSQLVSNTVPFLASCEAIGLNDCELSAPVD